MKIPALTDLLAEVLAKSAHRAEEMKLEKQASALKLAPVAAAAALATVPPSRPRRIFSGVERWALGLPVYTSVDIDKESEHSTARRTRAGIASAENLSAMAMIGTELAHPDRHRVERLRRELCYRLLREMTEPSEVAQQCDMTFAEVVEIKRRNNL